MGFCEDLLANNQFKCLYFALVLVLCVLIIMQLWRFGYYMERAHGEPLGKLLGGAENLWNPTPGPVTGHTHEDDVPIGQHYLGGTNEIYPDANNVLMTSSITGGAAVDYLGTSGANMRHGQINTDPGTGEDTDHLYHLLHQDFGGFRNEIGEDSMA